MLTPTIARAWIDLANADWDREARSYGPDEDDDDEDMPPETVVMDCPPACPNERVYCECPALEPYPDGWRTLAEHEAFDKLVTVFGSARRPISFDGRNAYIPGEPWSLMGRLVLDEIDLPHTEDVFSGAGAGGVAVLRFLHTHREDDDMNEIKHTPVVNVGTQWADSKGRTWEVVEKLPFGICAVRTTDRTRMGEMYLRDILAAIRKATGGK